MNYRNMGTSDRGKAQPPLPRQQQPTPSTPFSLARLQSVYSLTFEEFQNTLGGPGKDFGSMNMDELLRNIWTAEESQAMTYTLGSTMDSTAPAGISGTSGIQRQGSLTLPRTLSQKTVDEVWKDLFKEASVSGQVSGQMPEIKQQNRQPTLNEVTLEEFLVRAGVVREENNVNVQQQSLVASNRAQESSMNNNNFMFFNNGNQGLDLGFGQNSSGVGTAGPYQTQLQVGSNVDNGRGRMVGVGDQGMDNGLMNGVQGLGGVTVETVRSPDVIVKRNGDLSSLWPDPYNVFGSGTKGRKCSGSVEKVVERRQKRMIKNRESAARSRERKQAYTMELEAEVAKLKEQNQELEKKQAEIMKTQKNQVIEMMKQQRGPKKMCLLSRTRTGPW